MAHPPQFEPDDEVLARLRKLCLTFPGADEKVSHGRPMFFTKKVFAGFGYILKGGAGRFDHGLFFMPSESDRAALDEDPRIHVPAYWGPHGWRAIDLVAPDTDWVEVAELVEDSYRETAPASLIAALDARCRTPTTRCVPVRVLPVAVRGVEARGRRSTVRRGTMRRARRLGR